MSTSTPVAPSRTALRSFATAFFLLLSLLLFLPASSFAKDDGVRKRFDIPAGPAKATLKQFSEQAGGHVLYSTDGVGDVTTKEVRGRYTAKEALDVMLTGTPLVANQDTKTGAFAVRHENADEAKNVNRAIVQNSARPETSDTRYETDATGQKILKLDTFEVMGSKLLNMDIKRSRDDPQPYVIFSRQAIEESNATDLDDFLKGRLTMNTVGLSPGQSTSGTTQSTSSINLRGLGANQTLILVDGRRLPELFSVASFIQADIKGIPLAAVERVEVLPSTASGIYGGSATGGVINIILRRDYSGSEIKFTYGNAFDTDFATRRVDISAGLNLNGGKTNILLAASYSAASSLARGDRDLSVRGRNAIVSNNPASVYGALTPPLGKTANVRSQSGANLTLKSSGGSLNSPITTIPLGYAGAASDNGAALLVNAGKYNLGLADTQSLSFGARSALLNVPSQKALSATVRHQFSGAIQLFFEGSRTDSRISTPGAPGNAVASLSQTALNNPFNEAVYVTVPFPSSSAQVRSETMSERLGGGVLIQLPAEWKMELDSYWSVNRLKAQAAGTNSFTLNSALANGTIDPLRDYNSFPLDLSAYQPPAVPTDFSSTQTNFSGRSGGPVLSLPAGKMYLSLLGEYRHFSLPGQRYTTTAQRYVPSRSQSVQSGYAEVKMPLVGADSNVPGINSLDIQVAGRTDKYSITAADSSGTATEATPKIRQKLRSNNPTFALSYSPVSSVALRASFGTGFLPPDVTQLVSYPTSAFAAFVDPKRGGQSIVLSGSGNPFPANGGGNANLQPETSRSWSIGTVLNPKYLPGFRVSIDWTKIQKRDIIANSSDLMAIDFGAFEAAFPSRVVRGPNLPGDQPGWAGPITYLDATLVNVAQAEIEAYDVQIDYSKGTRGLGTFTLFSAMTWQTHYKTQLVAAAPIIENVGNTYSNPLKFKANVQATWKVAHWTIGWSAQYYDSYKVSTLASVIQNQGNLRVPGQIYHDIFAAFQFDGGKYSYLSDLELRVGVRNVCDKRPPFDANNTSQFYSPFGSPVGANYVISVKKAF